MQVFCDNYLDGGYHVPYAHGGLASGLKLDSYSTLVWTFLNIVFLSVTYSLCIVLAINFQPGIVILQWNAVEYHHPVFSFHISIVSES